VVIADYHNNSIAVSGGKAPGKNQSGNDKAVAAINLETMTPLQALITSW
jgi:hypothetical protein